MQRASARGAYLAEASTESDTLEIAAAGDILLTRSISSVLRGYGWRWPLAAVKPLTSAADLSFANLECPASYLGSPYPGKDPNITFRAEPGALFALKDAGFDVLSLANNHMTDWGGAAVEETIAALDLLGIAHVGAGGDAASAAAPALIETKGLRIAVLGYVEPMWSVVEASERPGVAPIREDTMLAAVGEARESADLVVVSLHWGEEHQGIPRERDRAMARRLVDAGASLILGHHPHVLQGAEAYHGALIVYSLGNFVFDMLSPKTYETMLALISTGSGGVIRATFVPVRIDRKLYRPAPAAGDDAAAIGKIFAERCAALGQEVERGEDGTVVLNVREAGATGSPGPKAPPR